MYTSEHSNSPETEPLFTRSKSDPNEIPERESQPGQSGLSEEDVRFLEEQHDLLEYWSDTIG